MPSDPAAISRRDVEDGKHDCQTQEGNCTVATSVVCRFLRDERSHQDGGECDQGGEPDAEFFRNGLVDPDARIVPDPMHWLGNNGDGNPEEDDPEGNGEPEQEGNKPPQVVAVQNEASNPPAEGWVRIDPFSPQDQRGRRQKYSPSEQQPNEQVHENLVLGV